jgi:hypothetical protein
MSVASPQYDLIRLNTNEDAGGIWFGTANTLEEAFAAIRQEARATPGKYMVYSQSAGSKAIYQATNGNVTPLNGAARAATHG